MYITRARIGGYTSLSTTSYAVSTLTRGRSYPEEEESCRPLDDDTRRRIRSQRAPSPNSSPFSTINLSDIETSRPPSRGRSDSEATAVPPPPSTSLWQSQNDRAPATNPRPQPPASYPTPPNSQAPALQLTGLAPPRHTSSTPHRPPTPPKMAEASDQNLHWARERLRDLDRFDGKELTVKQVESTWRKRFCKTVNAYKVSDNQRRALWLEHLEEPSLAAEWAERMEDEGKIGTWDALVKELGVRWPAPDEAEKQKERTERWYQHAIEEKKLGTRVEGIGGASEPYYVVWAREHMALAAEMGAGKVGEEKFMVEWTWHRALQVPSRAEAAQKATNDLVNQLNKRIASLEIQSRATTHMADPSQTTAQPKASAATPKGAITQPNPPAKSTKSRGQTFGKNPTGYDLYQAAVSNLPINWLSMQNFPLTPALLVNQLKEMEWRKRAKEELGAVKPGPTKAEIFQVLVEKFGKEVAEILPNNAHMPPTLPFQQWTYLTADKNHAVKTQGTIDAGLQANVLDAALWAANKILLGKPWLTQVKATQSFVDNTLHLPGLRPIPNAYPLTEKRTEEPEELKTEPEEAKVELKEEEPKKEQGHRRSRRLAAKGSRYWVSKTQVALLEAEGKTSSSQQERAEALALEKESEILNINKVHDAHIPVNQSQQQTNPFAAERVAKIQNRVVVGNNLLESQKASIQALVASYADVFALDLLESNTTANGPTKREEKFWLVHNFAEVNKVTQIPAFPMGDLAAKQRNVAGYKRVCTIDFASGFNALPMEESSIKYTGFYVEGRGHYVYLRMPFGLTGAPTAFCEMLADALYDLLGDGAEVWMDDICLAFNDFDEGLSKLGRLLDRCRVRGLSIAPAKTHLFMEEAVFAGAKVSERGIEPDREKYRLYWNGRSQPKIKDYARIAQPLSDLVRTVKVKKRADGRLVKGEYKRALENAKVELTDEAKKAFIELKLILTTNPVLRAPEYDGRSFRITTDLVQKYDPRWDNTHSNERKLAQRWSNPLRIRERRNASYVLEDLEGNIVSLSTHARYLRPYTPEPKSTLHKADRLAPEEPEPPFPGSHEDF
ncbi:hypothetical protein RHS01_00299 [Rhizoctonia solani]|uniref:Reverse transcriptase domain-containing protein n=1 Tax=Rhizoctonia solani TaxID=456999 RepID=A0A8H7IJI2_9AGAM|nr:hypothetical protein RHS01_00299 [Rhizoctonia solani]